MDTLVLTLQLALACFSLGCLVYVLIRLAQEKGALHALLGFIFPLYPFGWGWLNGKRLGILDVMGFWTAVTLLSVIFPAGMTWASLVAAPGFAFP